MYTVKNLASISGTQGATLTIQNLASISDTRGGQLKCERRKSKNQKNKLKNEKK
jgi:hypothetical protein